MEKMNKVRRWYLTIFFYKKFHAQKIHVCSPESGSQVTTSKRIQELEDSFNVRKDAGEI